MEKEVKICPLRFTKDGSANPCVEDDCAWWIKYSGEKGECVMLSIRLLAFFN